MIENFQLKGKFIVELVKFNGQRIKIAEMENIISNQGENKLLDIKKTNNNLITQEFSINDAVILII